jgi:hypothetical protein
MTEPRTFLFGNAAFPHAVGDTDCGACWNKPGRCWCGGLEHSEFGAENDDGSYWLHSRCDECGSEERR